MDYLDLRKKYPDFIYKSFHHEMVREDMVCSFVYSIKPDIEFNHRIVIKDVGIKYKLLDKNVLDNLVFNIGLVEIPSYWKTTCSSVIKIEVGNLDSWQIDWWKKLYLKGMMQYYYENKIDFTQKDFLSLGCTVNSDYKAQRAKVKAQKTLIPIGGGKDSVVTLGLVEKSEINFGTLVVNKAPVAAHNVSNLSNRVHLITERKLDSEKITKLNNDGFLNGHIPYSASLYFISLLTSYIFGYSKILFSNENSSNEGNIKYLDREVNHQYSKTLEFENDFRHYNTKYLSNIDLFSFLRPLYEIQISKIFSKMEKYFPLIRSCNVGQKDGIWCGKCPKCLSTYILLLPFLGIKKTIGIFGKDMLSDKDLGNLFQTLIDESKVKPFECVGTRLELKVGLNMAFKLYINEKLPYLLESFKNSKLYDKALLESKEKAIMNSFGNNNLPAEFVKLLRFQL